MSMMDQRKASSLPQKPYIDRIKQQLTRSFVLLDTPCQHVDGGNKPEIELQTDEELLLPSITINRNEKEFALFEPSTNALRISFKLKPVDKLEDLLRKKQLQFYHRRAEALRLLRRKPVKGYDISFLLTAKHQQQLDKQAVIAFICELVEDISSCSSLKRLITAHGRASSKSLRRALS